MMRLVDAQMPMRNLAVADALREWNDQTRVPKDYFYPAIGPLLRSELQPAEQRGATTMIHAVLHHQFGEAEMTVELRQTVDGWCVLGLNSRVTSHPIPTAK